MSATPKGSMTRRPAKTAASASQEANMRQAFPDHTVPTKRLSADIDRELHRKIKNVANRDDTTVKDLIEGFIRGLE